MEKKREYAFDILRVIAMIMVIVVHVSNVYSRSFGLISNDSFFISLLFNTISRVSVPIFFMISGALLLDRNFELKKYRNRILKYVFLIVVWDIIYLIWEYFYLGVTYTKLYNLILNPYRAHLWFLYSILVVYILQPILRIVLYKISDNFKFILLCIWLIISTISIINSSVTLALTIFTYIGFFILGKYIYDFIRNNDLKRYSIIIIITMIICLLTSVFLNYLSSIRYQMFYNLYFAYKTPFITVASLCLYVLILINYQKDNLNKVIIQLSNLSLGVYLIHGIFLDITVKIFRYQLIPSIIGISLFTFIIFVLSIMSTYAIKHIKYLDNIIE